MANDKDELKPERRSKSSQPLSKYLTRPDQGTTKEKTNLNPFIDETVNKNAVIEVKPVALKQKKIS